MTFKIRLTLVVILVLGMFLLHNSFWWWDLDKHLPLLWGFMPFAFSYYVLYALLAAAVMFLVVKIAWPEPPEGIFEGTEDEELDDDLIRGNLEEANLTGERKG